jgi:hypothetical protein
MLTSFFDRLKPYKFASQKQPTKQSTNFWNVYHNALLKNIKSLSTEVKCLPKNVPTCLKGLSLNYMKIFRTCYQC